MHSCHRVENSIKFYRDVVGVTVRYSDNDFAALQLHGGDFMLHADHTYGHHPSYPRLLGSGPRDAGAEFGFLGVDPDAIEQRACSAGATIIQPARGYPHGCGEIVVADPDGYLWALGPAISTPPQTLAGITLPAVT